MKRMILCCDGTWQRAGQPAPTNVLRLARAILPRAPGPDGAPAAQIVRYDAGLGAGFTLAGAAAAERLGAGVTRILGGLFATGLEARICAAYQFLALNYEDGDELYLFGFSRGAYTVRSLAGMIYASGLVRRAFIHKTEEAFALYRAADVKPSDPRAAAFRSAYGRRVPVRFLGCWDTVGMRGVPDLDAPVLRWLSGAVNTRFRFHDNTLNTMIEHARHACALDEERKAFPLTPMQAARPGQLRQLWFAGDHGGVGGGEPASAGLADIALEWMAHEAHALGLESDLRAHTGDRFTPDPLQPAPARPHGPLDRLGRQARVIDPAALSSLHASVRVRYNALTPPWRPAALTPLHAVLEQATPSP